MARDIQINYGQQHFSEIVKFRDNNDGKESPLLDGDFNIQINEFTEIQKFEKNNHSLKDPSEFKTAASLNQADQM